MRRRAHDSRSTWPTASVRGLVSTQDMAPASRQVAVGGEAGHLASQIATALNGRFRIARTLGMGATGIVFEAYDREASEPIAIKMLYRIEPHGLLRLKREFRELSQIAHPNLVGVHELFVEQGGRGFFTMDLVQDAASFLDYLGPNPEGDRLRACLVQLVHGVQHLHSRRKLHRDLKPSNVLVDRNGRLRIVDFGLVASLRDQTGPVAGAGTFEGTPAYAAPEQIDAWRTTAASDWYAVGMMLYEVLAGRRPFDGSGRELLRRKAAEDPRAPVPRFGCALSPGLEQVCLRLLARDPSRRADGRDLLAALGVSDSASLGADPQQSAASECAVWPFIGRDLELARLEVVFSGAEHGAAPGGLLIQGASGFGKTSLARRFLDDLEASGRATVLRGRCLVLESIHYNALDGIFDALAGLLQSLPENELQSGLPRQVGALAQLFPVLNGVAAIEQAAALVPALQPHQVRGAALTALRELLAWLSARRPLVMFVDDLQWADADSARLLQDLLQAPLPSVWLLATFRNDARRSLESPDLERITATAEHLTLGPLSAPAVTELASLVLHGCPHALALEIARKSGGDPLLVSELIRYALCRGDLAALRNLELETALSARLAGLSPPARHLLELVCVGGRLPRALLLEGAPAALVSLRELRLALAVRESIVADAAHVEPHHDRVRELVIAELSADRSQWLHRSLAERLRANGATYLDQVARHYLRAGMLEQAGSIAETAARDAARGYAFHSAADLLELALSCASEPLEQQRLRVAAALACACAGRLFSSAEHYEQAAEAATDPAERGELRLQALTAYCVSGHGKKSRELLARSATELGVPLDFAPMTFGRGLWWMARLLLTATPRLRRSRSRGRLPTSAPADPALRLLWQTTPALMVVDPELSCQFAVRAMIRAAEQGEAAVYGQSLSFQLALFVLVLGRRSALLERRFEQAHRLAQLDGDVWGERFVRVMRACAELLLGELERTLADCMDVAQAAELGSTFAGSVRSSARGLVIPALFWLGRIGELALLIEPWLKEALDTGDRHLQITCRVLGAQRFLRTGDSARARQEIDAAGAIALDYTQQALIDPWWRVQIELYDGHPERALAMYEESLRNRPAYTRHCAPLQLSWLMTEAQCVAALAARGIDRDANIGRLERALRVARRYSGCSSAPVTLAHMAATLALLRGETARAAQQLRAARRGYEQRGMRLLAATMQLALARLEPGADATSAGAARLVFTAEGIREPERWAYMFAPALLPGSRTVG